MTLNTVSLPAKEQSLQKKKFVPSVEMLPEVTQRDLNVEAWVAFQALLEDRLERSWNVESKGCLIWERTCQTGKKREKKKTTGEFGFGSSGHIRISTQTNNHSPFVQH